MTCRRSKAYWIKKAFCSFVSSVSSQSCCQMKKKRGPVGVRFANVVQVYYYLFQMSRLFPAVPYHRPLIVKNPLPSCLLAAGSIGINSKPWSYYWGKWLFQRNNSFILGAKMKPFIPNTGIQMEVLTVLKMPVWPVWDWRRFSVKGEERRVVGKVVISFFRFLNI